MSDIDPVTKKPFRTLVEILREADQHFKDNPRHGIDCACLDSLCCEIRRQMMAVDCGSTEANQRNYKTGHRWATVIFARLQNETHRYDGPRDGADDV